MHPNFLGGSPNPYAVLGLDALAPYLGVTEASRGLISQGGGVFGNPYVGASMAAMTPQQPVHPAMLAPRAQHLAAPGGVNPLLAQMIQRQAAANFPQMTVSQPARKSGNSLGVNVEITLNGATGYSSSTWPTGDVSGSATQTLQSEFHGLKLSASAVYIGYYTLSGGGGNVTTYGSQPGGVASDVILQGVFVGGFNAQPLPPGTGLSDGGVSLAGFPPNGLGNGIDMLPGKIGQVVKCPLLIQPSIFSLFTVPSGATLYVTKARVFLTFFGDNLQ